MSIPSTTSRSSRATTANHRQGEGATAKLLASPWKFQQHGESGLWVSDLFPEVAKHADALCVVNSMQTDSRTSQAFLQLHAGIFQFSRPSMGAWVLYGLGNENENLPGFITLCPPANNGGPSNYGSAFLPAIYQGRGSDSTAPHHPGQGEQHCQSEAVRFRPRQQLDLVQTLNRTTLEHDR